MTYRDLLEAFKKVDKKYLALPIIIGGGDEYWHFIGFKLIGPTINRPLTGYNIIRILEDLPPSIVNLKIPTRLSDSSIEDDFYGDLNKISIGPLKARCAFVAIDETIYPLEDYCDNTPVDKINLLMKTQYPNGILLLPGTRLVITVSDGSMITDDSECIILER